MLEAYEKASPGAAERIITMAEREQRHRQDCDVKVVDGMVKESARGQWVMGGVSSLAVVGGVIAAIVGAGLPGAAIAIGVPTLLLARSFVAVFRGKKSSAGVQSNNNDGQLDLFDR